VARFTKVLIHSQTLQIAHQDVLKDRLARVETVLGQVNPAQDQDIFIDHNIRSFSVPADWTFEPCPNHYDTEQLSIEPAPKVFLQNKLSRCRMKLEELTVLIESKRIAIILICKLLLSNRTHHCVLGRESEQFSKLLVAYTNDHSLGNVDEISNDYLEANQQAVFYATSECILKAEIDTIVAALGGKFVHLAAVRS